MYTTEITRCTTRPAQLTHWAQVTDEWQSSFIWLSEGVGQVCGVSSNFCGVYYSNSLLLLHNIILSYNTFWACEAAIRLSAKETSNEYRTKRCTVQLLGDMCYGF